MKNEFLNYKLSLEIKKLGFNQFCFGYYTGDINHLVLRPNMSRLNTNDDNIVCAILFQQAFDWFRENYKLNASIYKWQPEFSKKMGHLEWEGSVNHFELKGIGGSKFFNSYEESQNFCINKLIKIVKNGK